MCVTTSPPPRRRRPSGRHRRSGSPRCASLAAYQGGVPDGSTSRPTIAIGVKQPTSSPNSVRSQSRADVSFVILYDTNVLYASTAAGYVDPRRTGRTRPVHTGPIAWQPRPPGDPGLSRSTSFIPDQRGRRNYATSSPVRRTSRRMCMPAATGFTRATTSSCGRSMIWCT
jgi:hypothetical protein